MTKENIQEQTIASYQDQDIKQYTLSNRLGTVVKVINYGATITSIELSSTDGKTKNIACGFDQFSGYLSQAYTNNAPYFGCTVGRYASRIKDGKFSLDGQSYDLAVNDGSNHLHGGIKGFDKKIWTGSVEETKGQQALKMSLQSPHMEEGYPGNVSVEVTFLLNDENELSIEYSATTDQSTPLSLTNHTYFNLSGFLDTIKNHQAMIKASRILVPDETNIPVGEEANVEGTVADLRTGNLLGNCLETLETGFEHFYVLDKAPFDLEKVAEFTDTESGLTLEIITNEPGALFYTGYFTSDELQRENGDQYGRYRGFCFETSRYPNGPNLEDAPGAVTHPGETYRSQTIYKFSQQQNA